MSLTIAALVVSCVSLLGLVILGLKVSRGPKEDQRLSQGLQLLQSKIAILEDLSDRTDNQVTQLTNFLEHKSKQLQAKVQEAQEHLRLIDQATNKSLEVATIFQDKIPHEEIIERKNTIKYVQAARLSHQGKSLDEIALEVDLPRSEIEMIAKVNRDELVFSDQKLPEWAKKMVTDSPKKTTGPLIEMNDGSKRIPATSTRKSFEVDYSKAFEVAKPDLTQVKQMNKDLKMSSQPQEKTFLEKPLPTEGLAKVANHLVGAAKNIGDRIVTATGQILTEQGARSSERLSERVQINSNVQPRNADDNQSTLARRSELARANSKAVASSNPNPSSKAEAGQYADPSPTSKTTTTVVPHSYVKDNLNVNKNETKEVNSQDIKKVMFPKIDLNDNLG